MLEKSRYKMLLTMGLDQDKICVNKVSTDNKKKNTFSIKAYTHFTSTVR